MAVGYFPATKLNLKYNEKLWIKARTMFFKHLMLQKDIASALRMNYDSLRNRATKEHWAYWKTQDTLPEEFFTVKEEIITLHRAAQEANVWKRRKRMDIRRKEVIETAGKAIMTREQRAKEQLDSATELGESLKGHLQAAINGLDAVKEGEALNPRLIRSVKDLVSAHGKLCDTLMKLEKTNLPHMGGIPLDPGWNGLLSAVRLKDEQKVLQAQAVREAIPAELVEETTERQDPFPVPFGTPRPSAPFVASGTG